MPGVPGAGGPPPKRSSQRRRNNSPGTESAPAAVSVSPWESDPEWHEVARRWFDSLAGSGQSQFYEPSDWATAYLIAESISRELKPQPMQIDKGKDGGGVVSELVSLPPKGASLAAWLKGMTTLMVTEGDRRRMRLELERSQPGEGEEEADVSEIAIYRRRLQSG